jgi:hypothetical protein
VVTPFVLVDIVSAVPARTFLARSIDLSLTCRLFSGLVLLLSTRDPIVVLFARLSLVPCPLVLDTDGKSAIVADASRIVDGAVVNLARVAAGPETPSEVRIVVEGVAHGEGIESANRALAMLLVDTAEGSKYF